MRVALLRALAFKSIWSSILSSPPSRSVRGPEDGCGAGSAVEDGVLLQASAWVGGSRFINYTVAGSCVRGLVWACPSAVTLPPRGPGAPPRAGASSPSNNIQQPAQ